MSEKEQIKHMVEEYNCEQTTGIPQVGKLVFWNKNKKISVSEASKNIREGKEVVVPSAGAGSFRKVFRILYYTEIKVIEWTSSAGDWSFGVKEGENWFIASQENRHPYYGFSYGVNYNEPFSSFDEIKKYIESL